MVRVSSLYVDMTLLIFIFVISFKCCYGRYKLLSIFIFTAFQMLLLLLCYKYYDTMYYVHAWLTSISLLPILCLESSNLQVCLDSY